MTPTVMLPAVIPGETTHVRRYTTDRRPYWACSVAGWGPCAGHGSPPPPTRQPDTCPRRHDPARMRRTTNGHGNPSRRCLDCHNELRRRVA